MKRYLSGLLTGIIITLSIGVFAVPNLTAYYNNDIGVRVNGKYIDVTPITVIEDDQISGNNFLPVKALCEALGYKVTYDAEIKAIDLYKPTVEDVAKQAEGCVMITAYKNGKYVGSGSGIVWNSCHIITNKHVLDMGDEYGIQYEETPDGKEYRTKDKIYIDSDLDIAIIKAPVLIHKSVSLGTSSYAKKGQQVVTISSPTAHKNTVTQGIISDLVNVGGVDYLQITAETGPGSSGGAVFDMDGRLIGIIKSNENKNMTFAVVVDQVIPVLESLIEK